MLGIPTRWDIVFPPTEIFGPLGASLMQGGNRTVGADFAVLLAIKDAVDR